MATHSASGTTLCIHSVVVDAPHRRRGLGVWMVRNYLARVALACPHVTRALLLTKPGNVGVYSTWDPCLGSGGGGRLSVTLTAGGGGGGGGACAPPRGGPQARASYTTPQHQDARTETGSARLDQKKN